ncbi:hypothetical protein, partial [Helicobacter sp. UBA3407]
MCAILSRKRPTPKTMRDSALYRLIFVQPHNGETKLFLCGITLLTFYALAIITCFLLQNGIGDKLLS